MKSVASRAARRDVLLLVILVVGALVHLAANHATLPERVPSHFDAQGVVDGWMSRDAFVATMAFVYGMTGGLFLAVVKFLPRMPNSMINLPNRDYWLAPERRDASLAELGRRLARFGAVTIVLAIGIVQETILVAHGERQTLDSFVLDFAGGFEIQEVESGGEALRYRYENGRIACALPSTLAAGDRVRVRVQYRGQPKAEGGFDGFHWAETADGQPEVNGLQLMQDGHFSIVFDLTFPGRELSALTHAGTYQVEGKQITYKLRWWVQHVEGEGSIIAPVSESPEFDYDGTNLKLMFSSGSSQHWRRIAN